MKYVKNENNNTFLYLGPKREAKNGERNENQTRRGGEVQTRTGAENQI